MTVRGEAFDTRELPERVFYAQGVFLDAEDLLAEQTYHRGRLSRVLAYLHGSGTAAGLLVHWHAATRELKVEPGLAIDRVGRLIEVPRQACVHLPDWLDAQRAEAAAAGPGVSHPLALSVTPDGATLVVDVFVRFAVCERGRTPSFATGPFDAIDASVPHRLRDSYRLTLETRGHDAATPGNPWPPRLEGQSLEDHVRELRDHALHRAWSHADAQWPHGALAHDAGTEGTDDATSVFLARVAIPVTLDGRGDPLWRAVDGELAAPAVDNHLRRFAYGPDALLRLLEAFQTP